MVTPKRHSRVIRSKPGAQPGAANRTDLLHLDPDSPEFQAEARRQALRIANSPTEADEQAFVDSISIWPDDSDE